MDWYYNKGDEVVGSVSEEEILNLIKENIIGKDTLVWNEKMEDWKVISEVSVFKSSVQRKQPPPLPKELISPVESDENQNPVVINTYNDDGVLKSVESRNFRIDGLMYGKWESYYKNGKLKEKRVYKEGKLNGVWEKYSENGQLMWKRIYKDDELVDEKSGDNENIEKSRFIESQDKMKWFKIYIYVVIPFGILQSLIEITNPQFPISNFYSDTYIVWNGLNIIVLIIIFYGLLKRFIEVWYLNIIYIGIISFTSPLMLSDTMDIIILYIFCIIYFSLNLIYFSNRKVLFS